MEIKTSAYCFCLSLERPLFTTVILKVSMTRTEGSKNVNPIVKLNAQQNNLPF